MAWFLKVFASGTSFCLPCVERSLRNINSQPEKISHPQPPLLSVGSATADSQAVGLSQSISLLTIVRPGFHFLFTVD